MKTHQNKRVITKCLYCKETFYTIPNLSNHCKRSHPGLDWISNGIKWKTKSKKLRHDQPKCEICHKNFTRNENLRIHMQSHHFLNRSVLNCDLCSRSFNSNSNLKKHIRKFHSQTLDALQDHTLNENFNGFNNFDLENAQNTVDNVAGKLKICMNIISRQQK